MSEDYRSRLYWALNRLQQLTHSRQVQIEVDYRQVQVLAPMPTLNHTDFDGTSAAHVSHSNGVEVNIRSHDANTLVLIAEALSGELVRPSTVKNKAARLPQRNRKLELEDLGVRGRLLRLWGTEIRCSFIGERTGTQMA